ILYIPGVVGRFDHMAVDNSGGRVFVAENRLRTNCVLSSWTSTRAESSGLGFTLAPSRRDTLPDVQTSDSRRRSSEVFQFRSRSAICAATTDATSYLLKRSSVRLRGSDSSGSLIRLHRRQPSGSVRTYYSDILVLL